MSAQALDAPRGFVTKAEHYKALRKIDELEESLREARMALQQAKGMTLISRLRDLKLAPAQARLVAALLKAGTAVRYEALYSAVAPSYRQKSYDSPENILKVNACFARRVLKAQGCPTHVIVPIWATGYTLTPEARQWLSERVYGPSHEGGET